VITHDLAYRHDSHCDRFHQQRRRPGALHPWAAEAANAAKRNDPALIIWDFELEASS